MFLPAELIDIDRVRDDLTFKVYKQGDDEAQLVLAYQEQDTGLLVPREYGISFCKKRKIEYVDKTAFGNPINNLSEVALWDYQKPFVHQIVRTADSYYDFIASAYTGSGKTVMGIEAARRLGRTTLIVVDQEFLMRQWVEALNTLFGLPIEDIGLVQGKVCNYEGHSVCIAMIQTLYRREYDLEFYEYFGTVIFDESHTVGAPVFSTVLLKFPAMYRFGVSATPGRDDVLRKVILHNLGKVRVTLDKKHIKSSLRFIEYEGYTTDYANFSPKAGRFINELAGDGRRNLLIAEAVKWLWESGRDVLVISDRTEHLSNLKSLCGLLGIPEEEMGLCCRYHTVWKYAKDATPKGRPLHLEKDTEYTPVSLQPISKRVPNSVVEGVKNNSKVIFATYAIFGKGTNVPRLSGGVDATPRAKAEQVHGRILRTMDGKLVPIWVTIRDVNSYRAEYQFAKRIDEYKKSNAEVFLWDMNKGVRKLDHKVVKRNALARVEQLKPPRPATK